MWETHYRELLNEQHSEAAHYDQVHYDVLQEEVKHLENTYNTEMDNTGTLDTEFTVNEIANACKNLTNNKAPGYDRITNECLKYGGYTLYETLCKLYNAMIRLGYIPPSLKRSIIVPIFKGKGKSKTSMKSYRGVSLTPTLNKVLEKIVLRRLKPWLDNQDFPPALQHYTDPTRHVLTILYKY